MAFTNKYNKNDNTSGVSVLLTMLSKLDSNDVCFILYDNEEKGLKGSKAFNKKYKELIKDKILINLDCVGVGKNILVIANDDAAKLTEYRKLGETLKDNLNFKVLYYSRKGSAANSDHKNFKCGIGIVACNYKKGIGYYTTNIHTSKDVFADSANIDFLSDSLCSFVNTL